MLYKLKQTTLFCPVSSQKVDEKVVRLLATTTLLLAVLGLWLHSWLLWLALAVDFAIRATAWNGGKSPLRWFCKTAAQFLDFQPLYIDVAPKRFAAGIGVVFSVGTALSFGLEAYTAAYAIGSILIVCAFLEAAWSYCVGCVVYTYLVIPFLKNH